jgi:hypothetical protein
MFLGKQTKSIEVAETKLTNFAFLLNWQKRRRRWPRSTGPRLHHQGGGLQQELLLGLAESDDG